MNKSRGLFLIAFLLPPIIIFTVAIVVKRHKEHFAPVIGIRVADLLDDWNNANYDSSWDDQKLTNEINSIKCSGDLSNVQRQQLNASILNLLLAFHEGTCDAYMKFRIPIDHWQFSDGLSKLCAEDFGISEKDITDRKNIIFHHWWDKHIANEWVGFWNAISFDDRFTSIEIENSPKDSLSEYILNKKANAGVVETTPLVELIPSLKNIEQTNQNVVCSIVALLPKNKDVSYQVYCRFYWVPDENKWLPDNLVGAYSGKNRSHTLLW